MDDDPQADALIALMARIAPPSHHDSVEHNSAGTRLPPIHQDEPGDMMDPFQALGVQAFNHVRQDDTWTPY